MLSTAKHLVHERDIGLNAGGTFPSDARMLHFVQHDKGCWRVVKDDGSLNPTFSGGVEGHTMKLRAEGHEIVADEGKKPPRVADFEKSLT